MAAIKLLICASLLLVLTTLTEAGYSRPRPRVFLSRRGGRCGGRKYVCKRRLTCIRRICYAIVGEGRRCSARRYILCRSGLKCIKGRCTKPLILLPVGSSCMRSSQCKRGLTCAATPSGKKVCTTVVGAGSSCDLEGGITCSSGLKCIDGKCKKEVILLPVGSSCTRTSQCKKGLTCAATPSGKKVCTTVVGAGASCDLEGGITCSSGLKCIDGKCKKEVILLPVGSSCTRTSQCKKGLTCAATPSGKKVCTTVVGAGVSCDLEGGITCSSGLKCIDGKCKKEVILLPVGSSCTRTSQCKKGLTCAATPGGKKVCTTVVGAGASCDLEGGITCSSGLKCIDGKCKKEVILLPVGRPCTNDSQCKKDLTCAPTPSGKKVCTAIVGEGSSCDLEGGIACTSGLKCIKGKCTKPVILSGKGGPCKTSADCKPLLTCLATRRGRKCFDVQGVGHSCADKFEICAKGLKCKRDVCMRRRRYY